MGEKFNGLVEIQNGADVTTVGMDGDNADISAGGGGQNGDLIIKDSAGRQTLWARGQLKDVLLGPEVPGTTRLRLDGNDGDITARDASNRTVFQFNGNSASLYIGASGNEGDVIVRDGAGRSVFHVDGNTAAVYIGATGNEGDLQIRDGAGRTVLNFDSKVAALYIGAKGNEGDLQIRDGAGRTVFNFDSNAAALYVGANGNEGDIQVRDGAGRTVFNFNSQNAALYLGANGNEGDLILRNSSGKDTIHLDGGSGDIILKNADAAEQFDLAELVVAEPGMVMVLNDEGKLKPSSLEYDKNVVGVVAGAGNYRPGIILDHQEGATSRVKISVLGKVSCRADASYGAIEVGDPLTTSQTLGSAMKTNHLSRACGAIIGKALSPLRGGEGLVDVLISLQ